ncbi:universal stress protein [Tessaracoccus lacteus]|uniref:Universal stress protein n=1 Tax=Tessaracoccus lacteus TaxID=3041766 RepID=A0ABY8PX92_9ACTN|nr:universal stress protein [Tessaracoccus sp. T21]WGT47075.1 universal stress protein [Tessaracoccus sp. T21]
MRVLVWIAPATWPAAIEAAKLRPEDDDLTLVAVDDSHQLPRPIGGLLGRGSPPRDVASAALTADRAARLLKKAAAALGRDCTTAVLTGETERAVTRACDDADLLIMARDGDRSRLGPPSLGRAARFILDHAPCTVELIWPENPPSLSTIPPKPRHEPRH